MVWFLVFSILPFMAMAYIGWHIWCMMPTMWIWKVLVIVLMVGSFLLMFSSIRRSTDQLPLEWGTVVYEIGTSSVFVLLYLFILFLLLDLGRLVHLVPRTLLYHNGWMAAGIAVFMFVLFLYGNLHYKDKYREELTFESQKITRPVRLVMMSDLHLGYHNRRDELHRWIDIINAEHPDLVLIAGDIIDGSIRPLKDERMYEEFRRLKAPVYACLGNHEYYSGEPDAQRFYQQAGIQLLQDSATVVGDLCIIGRDDRTNQHRQSLGAIMKKTALNGQYTILLDHQPYHLEQARAAGYRFSVQRAYPLRTGVAHLLDYRCRLRVCLRSPSAWRHPLLHLQRSRHLGRQVPHRHPLRICCRQPEGRISRTAIPPLSSLRPFPFRLSPLRLFPSWAHRRTGIQATPPCSVSSRPHSARHCLSGPVA